MSLTTSGPFPIKPIDPLQASFTTPEDKHGDFYRQYMHCPSSEERAQVVANINSYQDFDPNYDRGLFFNRAAENGDIPFLELLIIKSSKSPDLTLNINGALSIAAYRGNTACVKFLLDREADPRSIQGTTAYSSHLHIQEILETKINKIDTVDAIPSIRHLVSPMLSLLRRIEILPVEIFLMIASQVSIKEDLLTLTALSPRLNNWRFPKEATLRAGVFKSQIWDKLPYNPEIENAPRLCFAHLETLTLCLNKEAAQKLERNQYINWDQLQRYSQGKGRFPTCKTLRLIHATVPQIQFLMQEFAKNSAANSRPQLELIDLDLSALDELSRLTFSLTLTSIEVHIKEKETLHLKEILAKEVFSKLVYLTINGEIEGEAKDEDEEDRSQGLGEFPQLASLTIVGSVAWLKKGLGQFPLLTQLIIKGGVFTLPQGLGEFPHLEELTIEGVKEECSIYMLPEGLGQFPQLKKLTISNGASDVPLGLGDFPHLEELTIGGEFSLTQDLGNFPLLRKLTSKKTVLTLKTLGTLPKLEQFTIDADENDGWEYDVIHDLPQKFGHFPELSRLIINGSFGEGVENFEQFNQISELIINGWVVDLPNGIGEFPLLKRLTVGDSMYNLSQGLGYLPQLEKLTVVERVFDLPQGLGQLPHLTYLSIGSIEEELPQALGNLPRLTDLSIGFIQKEITEELDILRDLPILTVNGKLTDNAVRTVDRLFPSLMDIEIDKHIYYRTDERSWLIKSLPPRP